MDKLSCKELGGAAAVAHVRWPLRRQASPSCEQERCVNFCLVPLSPSSSKWSTSSAGREREREPARGGSREVGGGGRWTPHTDSLCALGRGAHYCEGVCIGGGKLRWASWGMNTRRRPHCSHLEMVIAPRSLAFSNGSSFIFPFEVSPALQPPPNHHSSSWELPPTESKYLPQQWLHFMNMCMQQADLLTQLSKTYHWF